MRIIAQNPYCLVVIVPHLLSNSSLLDGDALVIRRDLFRTEIVGDDDGVTIFEHPSLFSIDDPALCFSAMFYNRLEIMLA